MYMCHVFVYNHEFTIVDAYVNMCFENGARSRKKKNSKSSDNLGNYYIQYVQYIMCRCNLM